MTITTFLDALAGVFSNPVEEMVRWSRRTAFRRDLRRLLDTPHLCADVGFDCEKARAEVARLPWQPITLRRGGTLGEVGPAVEWETVGAEVRLNWPGCAG